MSFAIIKLPNEPIIIVTGAVPLENYLEPLHSTFAHIDRIASETDCLLHCIADAHNLDNLSFSDILIWIDEQRNTGAGSVRDSRVRTYVVGTHKLLPIAIKKTRQQLGVELPLFETLDEALAYIREQIES